MSYPKQTEVATKRRRLRLKDELFLALLPTVTVLLTLALLQALCRQHLLCATLASSAVLIYLDPEHQTNTIRTLIISQMTAAGIGWAMWSLFGPGYVSAGTAMSATIAMMVLLNAIHPPAATTALAFSLQPDSGSSLVLFSLAIAITAVLVFLQRAVMWLLGHRL